MENFDAWKKSTAEERKKSPEENKNKKRCQTIFFLSFSLVIRSVHFFAN